MSDVANTGPLKRKLIWRRARWTGYALVAFGILGPIVAFGITYLAVQAPDVTAIRAVQNQNHGFVSIDRLPTSVRHAVEAAEEPGFDTSTGFGAAGITQQYVNYATAGAGSTFVNLVKSVKLTDQAPKDQILQAYLTTTYFGRGAYGIQAASRAFFGKDAKDLNVSEAAFLAGCIDRPSSNNDGAWMTSQWRAVMDRLSDNNWITPAEKARFATPPTPIS